MTKPTNIQAKRAEKGTAAPDPEAAEELAKLLKTPGPAVAAEEVAESEAQAEAQALGAVQVNIEEMFQIIGAQDYELRALRQRVQIMAQQVVTLKGVIRTLEAAAKK